MYLQPPASENKSALPAAHPLPPPREKHHNTQSPITPKTISAAITASAFFSSDVSLKSIVAPQQNKPRAPPPR